MKLILLQFILIIGLKLLRVNAEIKKGSSKVYSDGYGYLPGKCQETSCGDDWRVGCNWCTCRDGRQFCTRKNCTEEELQEAEEEQDCIGTAKWTKDCNWCNCKDGYAMCTKKECKPNELRGTKKWSCHISNSAMCPEYRMIEYMAVKGCIPVYDGNECCATRFECPATPLNSKVPEGKCYYRGGLLNMGESVPENKECLYGCFCASPEITCAIPDCPIISEPNPNCWKKSTLEDCCPNEIGCPETDSVQCKWGGKTYREGQIINDDSYGYSCQKCICSENFKNPFGYGCKTIQCGYDFSSENQNKILNGCVPIFRKAKCCAFDFLCPTPEIHKRTQPEIKDSEKEFCIFGEIKIAVGKSLNLGDENSLKCKCLLPPSLLCRDD